MNRRGFLGSILAACAAPAIVRADSLMRIVPLDTEVLRFYSVDVGGETFDLLDGELGRYDGVRIITCSPQAAKVFAAALFRETLRAPRLSATLELLANAGVIERVERS